jgi:hypothetical protein
VFLNSRTYSNFLTFGSVSVDAESHFLSTESTPSETPYRLSQHRVRLNVNLVNEEIFVNVGAFCVDAVDTKSHSVLTQLTWCLTLH